MAQPHKKLTVTIETQTEQPDKVAPIVGYFPSGYVPKPNKPPLVKLLRHKKKPKRLQLVVQPKEGSPLSFVGTNFSGEAASGRMCSYALGVLDKVAKKLKIVPIAANKIFRLEPRVEALGVSHKEPATPVQTERTAEDGLSELNSLTNLYGTNVAIKRGKIKERLTQQGNEEELKQMVDETAIDKKALAITSAEITGDIPPHDLSATTPEKAYPLEQIILKGEWDYLLDILKLVQAGEELNPDSYPSFVQNRVSRLKDKDDEEKIRLAGLLSYISYLVKFKDQHTVDGYSSAKHHKIPSMLFQKFTKMFVNVERKRLAEDKINLLISYVLVLTLFVDNFESDFTDIARDLRFATLSLRPYFENLGCKFRSKDKVTIATLPVPLKFSVLRRKRRRG